MAKKSKTQKSIEKEIKKMHPLTKFIAAVSFIVALVVAFSASYFIQKNDKFELIGEQTITMNVGGKYIEPSLNDAIVCVSFGRNVNSSVTINNQESTYDPTTSPTVAGTYYIVYQTSDFKFKDITRIRKIVVNEIDINEDGIGD